MLSLILCGCGPVLIGHEGSPQSAGSGAVEEPVTAGTPAAMSDTLGLAITVQSVDCGACFRVSVVGVGGQPPYAFEWEDQSRAAERQVCVTGTAASVELKVVAQDATSARSREYVAHLESDADAGCAPPLPDPPVPKLCLKNGSLEGTPTPNWGQPQSFDAPPWTACTNPVVATNTPDIGNDTIDQMVAVVPKPTDGLTYLALGEDEQVSQTLCEAVPAGSELHMALDLSRINLGEGVVPETEAVFLEIWGGIAADCSQRELLWASGPLQVGWERRCATLMPHNYMDQLTLRANSDKTQLSPAYLIVDNMVPQSECP